MNYKIITCVNNSLNMIWQIHAYLENLLEIGWIDNTEVLIYVNEPPLPQWKIVQECYPTAKFHFYYGDSFTRNIIPLYLPIIRPFLLKEHFKRWKELSTYTIVYTDADILWVEAPDLEEYSKNNECFVSSTVVPSDYMSYKYLLGKEEAVDEKKKEEYSKIDVLQHLADICLINKQDIIDNYDNCGGVQYILNGVDEQFWLKVMTDCLSIRIEMQNLNQNYMRGSSPDEREINGFQSWCADLWAVFYNLIYRRFKISSPNSLNFAWAPDSLERLKSAPIFHNAGITSDATLRTDTRDENGKRIEINAPAFFKGKYISSTPFTDISSLRSIVNNPISKNYCTAYYTNHLIRLQEKYNLNY